MAIFVPRFVRQLRDVLLTAPADGEVLTYDSADEKWKNEAGSGGGGDLTDAVIRDPATSARNRIQPTEPDVIGLTIRAPVGSFEAETWILLIEDEFGNIRTRIDSVGDYDIRLNDDVDFPGAFKIGAGAHGNVIFVSQELGHLFRLFVGKKLSVLDSTNLNELFAIDEASGDVTVAGDLVVVTTDSRLADARTPTAHKTSHENGGGDEISLAGLDGTPVELTNHLTDAADAHDASAVSFVPTGTIAATDVQAAIAEVASEAGGGGISPTLFDANTVLAADTDDTPAALTMGASTILARLAAGNIKAATPAELRTLLALVVGTDVQAFDSDLAAIAALADPNADRILFWDDSAGAYTFLTPGTNLTITGTTIDAAGGGGGITLPYKSGSWKVTNGPPAGDLTGVPVKDRVTYHGFEVLSDCVIDRLSLGVSTAGTAGAKVRLGIFLPGADGRPDALLVDGGTINGDSNTYQDANALTTQALAGGTIYWIAVVWQVQAVGSGVLRASAIGAGAEYVTLTAVSTDPRVCSYIQAGVTGALPANATPTDAGAVTQTPAVKVRFV